MRIDYQRCSDSLRCDASCAARAWATRQKQQTVRAIERGWRVSRLSLRSAAGISASALRELRAWGMDSGTRHGTHDETKPQRNEDRNTAPAILSHTDRAFPSPLCTHRHRCLLVSWASRGSLGGDSVTPWEHGDRWEPRRVYVRSQTVAIARSPPLSPPPPIAQCSLRSSVAVRRR